MEMKYASVCSGVEAATLAWEYLGWEPVWFSEIDPFPCAVLKERFSNVPNLGDMTKINVENLENGDQKFTNETGTNVIVPGGVDLLVGGTPCQSFSVAGKREGLDGASGLAKTFVELLYAMRPRWFVWENVPGCLSSRDKRTGIYDFNFLLAAFTGGGIVARGKFLTANMSVWTDTLVPFLKEDGVCSLSDILETNGNIPQEYYLSRKACLGILRRAASRGKDLPPLLKEALERQAAHGTAPELILH